MRPVGIITAIAVGIVLALGTPAWSDKDKKEKEEGNIAEMAKEAKVTVDQAIKTATEKVPGTVVEAELEKKHDKTVWEVEVLGADGHVTEVHIDAATGAVIDTEAKKEEKHEKHEGRKEGKKGK
jgi:uncharacterized membrane protein YkoI